MAAQVIDYEAVIQDLERRRATINADLDRAIAALRQISSLRPTGPPAPIDPTLPFTTDRLQPYGGMPLVTAAMAHIRKVGHPVPNLSLARELENGGFAHNSKNFPNTLNSVLWRRAKTIGDIRKSPEGWGVAS